jgi:hypothetical protein
VKDFTRAIISPLSMPMDSLLRLSDEALVDTMQTDRAAQGDRFDSLVETIVRQRPQTRFGAFLKFE